jgi:hypothetical protein
VKPAYYNCKGLIFSPVVDRSHLVQLFVLN